VTARGDGEAILGPEEHPRAQAEAVAATARQAIRRLGLDRDDRVASALRSGRPGPPALVERLDEPGAAYWLVPWQVEGGVAFVAQVDAAGREMLGASVFPEPVPSPVLPPDRAVALVRRRRARLGPGAPRLVWMPCRQTTAPSRPFYEVPTEDGPVYVDMDGVVFDRPAPLGRGGAGAGAGTG